MKVIHIPCLEDNYAYLVIDEKTKQGLVVDPVEPEKVISVAKEHGVELKLVLTTHHHWDHAGGNEKIKELVPGIKVYGGSIDNVKGCTNKVENGDKLSLGDGISILSLHTPCHTKGHISYYLTGEEGEDPHPHPLSKTLIAPRVFQPPFLSHLINPTFVTTIIMPKSSKKSAVKAEVAPAVVAPVKSGKKGKRDAEEIIEKQVVSSKKQKVVNGAVVQAIEKTKTETKTKKSSKKKDSSSDEDSSDSESEEEQKKVVAKKPAPAKKVESSSEEESDDSSSEDEAPKKPVAAAKNGAAAAKKVESSSESDSDDSSDEEEAKPATKKPAPAAAKNGKKADSSSEDSSDDDSDSEEEVKAAPAKKPAAAVAAPKKDESSDESSEEDSSSDEEEPQKKKAKPTEVKPAAKPAAAKVEESSEDESSEEESSDDEPAKPAVKKTAAKKESSSGEEESSEEEESSDEEEEPKTAKKNTDVEMVDAPSAKKAPQTPATPQATGSKTIFMGNLSFSIEENDIVNFFKDVGEVAEVRFAMRDERFAGYGHVEFTTPDAAQKALELNGSDLLGRDVKIDLAKERGERGSYTPGGNDRSFQKSGGQGQGQSVFVRGFGADDDFDSLRATLEGHFGGCGEISRLAIPKDYDTGAPKGIAFIDFADSNGFNKALELNGTEVGGGYITVSESKPRNDGGSSGGGRFDGGRGRDGGRFGSGGGRFGSGRGRDGGRGRGRGRDSGGRGRGRGPSRPSMAQPGTGKKTTFGDD